MNNSYTLFNAAETTKSLDSSQSLDIVNLKVAIRPVKFYKLLQCEKSKIHDYSYITTKIRSILEANSQNIILFLKYSSQEEIKLANESEWIAYFESSNTTKSIMEFMDSKNTIKIEYILVKNTENFSNLDTSISDISMEQRNQENKLKNLFVEKDKIGFDILKSIFSLILKNDQLKNRIKDDLINGPCKNEKIENAINSKYFDNLLQTYLEKTIDKLRNISKIKKDMQNEFDENSEIILDDNSTSDLMGELPAFSEYYKNEDIEVFRSKIISESFATIYPDLINEYNSNVNLK